MTPNYKKYPAPTQCKALWKIGTDAILRDANNAPVPIRDHAKNQTVILHRCLSLAPGIVAWVIRHGDFPEQRIFSINGDNSDLRAANWKVEALDLPNPLDADILKLAIRYDEDTGNFVWRAREPRNINDRTLLQNHAGKEVECSTSSGGYLYFKVFGVKKMAHQWAWLYISGSLPANGFSIDHINQIKTDNRIDNLRAVSIAKNNLNKPGVKGSRQSKPRSQRVDYPTFSWLREHLRHDKINGAFYWLPRRGTDRQTRKFNTQHANTRAGRYTGQAPVLIRVCGKRYLAQDLLWIFYNHEAPAQRLFCINGNQQDLTSENWVLNNQAEIPFSDLSLADKRRRLTDRFDYDANNGEFVHKERIGARIGVRTINARKTDRKAGYLQNGYWRVTIDGVDYQASHLAILWLKGIWAPDTGLVVDHINGNGLDNRANNLRLVDLGKNARNRAITKRNQSGHPGVCKDIQSPNKWRAYICVNGKHRTIGVFNSFYEAKSERVAAELNARSIGIDIRPDLSPESLINP